jgi:hypothetical protein
MIKTFLSTGLVVVLLASACQASSRPSPQAPTPANVNLTLHILNSSRDIESIDIQVYIDDQLEVDDTFSNQSELPSIAAHKTFQFRLGKGRHTLKAMSVTGAARLEQEFEISDRHWASLRYESGLGSRLSPGQFEFSIQDTRIYFQ